MFTYYRRLLSSGSIEEKIIQRQLSKEGLADIIDDREQVNQFSTGRLMTMLIMIVMMMIVVTILMMMM